MAFRMTKEEIDNLNLEQVEKLAKELRQDIANHPYNLGQVIEMDEYDALEEMKILHGLLGERYDILRFEEYQKEIQEQQ